MSKHRDLLVRICRDTRSVELMDKFEGYGKSDGKPYDRMKIINSYSGISDDGEWFAYSLVVERKPPKATPIGDITFTEFKQGRTYGLQKHIERAVNNDIIKKYSGTGKVFHLEEYYRLRAQNSLNRTGYGWTWDWTDGYGDYTEGTYYGETTEYIFSGIIIEYNKPIGKK